MPDENQPQTPMPSAGESQPAEKPLSLREVAEAAYDEVEAGYDDDASSGEEPESVDKSSVRRDELGRFAKAEPGEADQEPPGPSPDDDLGAQPPDGRTQPLETGSSSSAPANWSAEDRQTFEKLPSEGKAFLLRRHSEMEGEFQRRAQAYGAAAQFAEQLAPVFGDPVIAGSLQQAGLGPADAIHQWGGFHRRAMDPDPRVRQGLLVELAERMGLNPAAVGRPSPPAIPGLTDEDMKNPVIRHITDQIAEATRGQQALRSELQSIRQQEQQAAQQQTLRVTRWGIDNFADERGPDGKPLRPYFDRVLPHVIELYKANPGRDLNEAYQKACRMDDAVFAEIQRAEAAKAASASSNQRAAQAARSNTRGRTVPVIGPNGAADSPPKSLRETLEASADEVGF